MELYSAIAKLGAVLVPLSWRMAPPEVAYVLNDCEAKLLFLGEDFLDIGLYIRDNVEYVREFVVLGQEDVPLVFLKALSFLTGRPFIMP